jgi:hypothetical protein
MLDLRQHGAEFQDQLGQAYDFYDYLNRPPEPRQQLDMMLHWQREFGDKLSAPAAAQLQQSIGGLQEYFHHHDPNG